MRFESREDAARLLAERLLDLRGENPLVLAMPRGGVPMAAVIAHAIRGEVNIMAVRKIPSPWNPEFGIGAVGESGDVYLDERFPRMGIPRSYVSKETEKQIGILRRRRHLYNIKEYDSGGRIVVLVDDGIATGSTMIAAVREARKQGPARINVASAVASPRAIGLLKKEADELAILQVPEDFQSVGPYFLEFPQLTDDDVVRVLARTRAAPAPFYETGA